MTKLTETELRQGLTTLQGWDVKEGKLHRDYQFPDFIHAFGFMATAALAIEKLDHHPEWFNVYNKVAVDLTTHDAGGISAKDLELARLLDAIAVRMA